MQAGEDAEVSKALRAIKTKRLRPQWASGAWAWQGSGRSGPWVRAQFAPVAMTAVVLAFGSLWPMISTRSS